VFAKFQTLGRGKYRVGRLSGCRIRRKIEQPSGRMNSYSAIVFDQERQPRGRRGAQGVASQRQPGVEPAEAGFERSRHLVGRMFQPFQRPLAFQLAVLRDPLPAEPGEGAAQKAHRSEEYRQPILPRPEPVRRTHRGTSIVAILADPGKHACR
jgi:hypothetical protein